MKKKKQPIFLLDHKLKWKTFKILQEKLVKDGGPTPIGADKVLWRLLKEKKIYCWFDHKFGGDMMLGLKLPKGKEVKVIGNP